MNKTWFKKFKLLFSTKKNLRIIYTILTIIAVYYALITGIFLLLLIPLIVSWIIGADGVEFYNVSSSKEIQRTDISYFTTGDIVGSIKLLLILAILVFFIVKLRKMEKKLT